MGDETLCRCGHDKAAHEYEYSPVKGHCSHGGTNGVPECRCARYTPTQDMTDLPDTERCICGHLWLAHDDDACRPDNEKCSCTGRTPSPTDLPDAVVEAAAEALYRHTFKDMRGWNYADPPENWLQQARAALAAASGPWAEQLDTAKRDGQIEVARAFQAWAVTNEIAENIDWKWFGEICRRYSDIYETGDDSE